MQIKSSKGFLIHLLLIVSLLQPGAIEVCDAAALEIPLAQPTPSVKLLIFEAHPLQKSILARWATANEINMTSYELQRCTKLPDFVTITTLAPTGTLGGTATYHFEDENVLFQQLYYYRLKMTDSSGVVTFSKTSSAVLDDIKGLFEATNKPYQTSTDISYELLQESDVKIEVFDYKGKYEYTILKMHQTKGYYNCHFSAKEKKLPPGIYCIRMTQGKATYSKLVSVE